MVPEFTGAALGAKAVTCAWNVKVLPPVTRVTLGAEVCVAAAFTVRVAEVLVLVTNPVPAAGVYVAVTVYGPAVLGPGGVIMQE
jgi:hypothetical protein